MMVSLGFASVGQVWWFDCFFERSSAAKSQTNLRRLWDLITIWKSRTFHDNFKFLTSLERQNLLRKILILRSQPNLIQSWNITNSAVKLHTSSIVINIRLSFCLHILTVSESFSSQPILLIEPNKEGSDFPPRFHKLFLFNEGNQIRKETST